MEETSELVDYQLFRQQALAEGIAASGKYEFVVSCVAHPREGESLAATVAARRHPS